MTARLQELLRQQALLDEHAAWLKREIAGETARAGETSAPAEPAIPVTEPSSPRTRVDAEADAILEQYRGSPQSIHQLVKRGCILYLIGALALTALSVFAVYYFYRSG